MIKKNTLYEFYIQIENGNRKRIYEMDIKTYQKYQKKLEDLREYLKKDIKDRFKREEIVSNILNIWYS
jgi:hypothetical protein